MKVSGHPNPTQIDLSPRKRTYSLAELCEMFDFTPRQLHDFRAKGAMPPPDGTGRGARYSDVHVKRLQAIKPLVEAGISVSRISARYASVDVEKSSDQQGGDPVTSEQWERVRIDAGLELAMLVGGSLEGRRRELLSHLIDEARRFTSEKMMR